MAKQLKWWSFSKKTWMRHQQHWWSAQLPTLSRKTNNIKKHRTVIMYRTNHDSLPFLCSMFSSIPRSRTNRNLIYMHGSHTHTAQCIIYTTHCAMVEAPAKHFTKKRPLHFCLDYPVHWTVFNPVAISHTQFNDVGTIPYVFKAMQW